MLAQRHRRGASISPALGQRVVGCLMKDVLSPLAAARISVLAFISENPEITRISGTILAQ